MAPGNHGAGPLTRKEPSLQGASAEYFRDVSADGGVEAGRFLLWAYGLLLASTLGIVLLQGFRVAGFDLRPDLVKWLGVASVGEVAGLLVLAFRVKVK